MAISHTLTYLSITGFCRGFHSCGTLPWPFPTASELNMVEIGFYGTLFGQAPSKILLDLSNKGAIEPNSHYMRFISRGSIRSLSPRQIHTYTPRMALNAATAAREARWTSNTRHTGHWLDPRTWSWNCARTIADDFISRWDGSWSRGHFWSAPALPLRFFVHLIAVCARAGYVTRAPIANCSSRLLRSGPRPDPTPLLATVAAVCSVCQCVLGGANDGASVMMQSVRSRNRGKQMHSTDTHTHTHTHWRGRCMPSSVCVCTRLQSVTIVHYLEESLQPLEAFGAKYAKSSTVRFNFLFC